MAHHPWNTAFEWHDHHGPFAFLEEAQVRQFDRDGYVVLDRLFGPQELEPVIAELDRFEAKTERWLGHQGEGRFFIAEAGAITFSPNLTARSEVLAGFARHDGMLGICRDLIGPDVNLYWDLAVYKKPEKPRRFPWHQDNGYNYIDPQAYLTVWIALTDATLDNGCPHIVPGVHRSGTLAHTFVEPLGWECFPTPPSSVATPLSAGDAVVFSSLTPHLTGPNTTEAVRKAYIVQYAPAGAVALIGDPDKAMPPERVPQDDPGYQFPVLRGGELGAAAAS